MKDALQISYDAITANSAQMAVYGIDYAYGLKPDAVRDGDTLQEHDGGRQQALIAGDMIITDLCAITCQIGNFI